MCRDENAPGSRPSQARSPGRDSGEGSHRLHRQAPGRVRRPGIRAFETRLGALTEKTEAQARRLAAPSRRSSRRRFKGSEPARSSARARLDSVAVKRDAARKLSALAPGVVTRDDPAEKDRRYSAGFGNAQRPFPARSPIWGEPGPARTTGWPAEEGELANVIRRTRGGRGRRWRTPPVLVAAARETSRGAQVDGRTAEADVPAAQVRRLGACAGRAQRSEF